MYLNFEDTDEFKLLVKKWGFKESDMINHFDDLVDDNIDFNYRQSIVGYEKKSNEFKLVILLYFEYALTRLKTISDTSYLYKFSDYSRFIKKQDEIFSLIESSVKRFVNAEHLTLEEGSGVSQIPFYMIQDERKNKLRLNYRLSLDIESTEAHDEYKKFISKENPLAEAKDELVMAFVEEGIKPEFAEALLDVDPDYSSKDSRVVLFGFAADHEIIVVATFDKDKKSLNINKREFERAVDAFYSRYCVNILGDNYIEENDQNM